MLKFTKHTLKKVEEFFSEIEYTIRYERGNFQSGYCIVENRKIAVINKFFDVEARINCLLDILSTLKIDEEELEDDSKTFYHKLRKFSLESAEESEKETTDKDDNGEKETIDEVESEEKEENVTTEKVD